MIQYIITNKLAGATLVPFTMNISHDPKNKNALNTNYFLLYTRTFDKLTS